MTLTADKILEYGARLMIIFMVLPIHEYAHAFAAYKLGDNTAMYKGRLTMNPLAHVDPFGALCLFLTGFGWAKPVPINPMKFKNQRAGMCISAAAGPLSNLFVAYLATIAYRVMFALSPKYSLETIMNYYKGEGWLHYTLLFLSFFISINIGLFIFNLIPIPPLDGSKIISYFTSVKYDMMMQRYQMQISFLFIILLITGILETPLRFLSGKAWDFLYWSTGYVDKIVEAIIR